MRNGKFGTECSREVWCKIRVGSGYDLFIGVCYRTPIEYVCGKDNHNKLRDMS